MATSSIENRSRSLMNNLIQYIVEIHQPSWEIKIKSINVVICQSYWCPDEQTHPWYFWDASAYLCWSANHLSCTIWNSQSKMANSEFEIRSCHHHGHWWTIPSQILLRFLHNKGSKSSITTLSLSHKEKYWQLYNGHDNIKDSLYLDFTWQIWRYHEAEYIC